ncbi:MAG: isoprenylcysteine carboxylmethyltransferase family protein [Anaerolineaceae bacterium]|nr:isoprenylcysteine carboxylmethyltransferase family protein [Anaerolineaceae bacterium]
MDQILGYIFLLGSLAFMYARAHFGKHQKQSAPAVKYPENFWSKLFVVLWGISQTLPFFHVLSDRFHLRTYSLPLWLQIAGLIPFFIGLWLVWLAHKDLGSNWSFNLQIQPEHQLVTTGIYQHIRHPMYTGFILFCIGQFLLIPAWAAGPTALISFLPIYFLRVAREEKMMLNQFGASYQNYMEQTGRIFPRWVFIRKVIQKIRPIAE